MDKIYFLGIGGIGMSAIAKYYNHEGMKVAGYDRTPSKITDMLANEGIDIHFEDSPALFDSFTGGDTENTLVIYTPAIPATLGEINHIREKGYRMVKRSRALGEITSGKKCYAVAGTHGKTGTSTLLAHIFTDSGTGCSAFLGGLSKNYGSNLLLYKNDIIVAEADEFDRSFLQLHPDTAVITATDADHLDIYGDLGTIRQAFSEFASQVTGTLILKSGITLDTTNVKARIMRYGIAGNNGETLPEFFADNIRPAEDGEFTFDLHLNGEKVTGCILGIPGRVNIENAVAASAAAYTAGIPADKIAAALASFKGVERRFDVRHKGRFTYIDDYAHHPEELRATIKSIRGIYPEKTLTGIFQPHLYTRTRDFADGFAEVLSLLDHILLLDIYPARELPIEGVTSGMIAEKIHAASGKTAIILKKEDIIPYLKEKSPELLVTFGAGDIDRLVPAITALYEEMENA